MLGSVLGAVLVVPGVLDAYAAENPAGNATTLGGVVLKAHSLLVTVAGGADAAVAQAIWSKKAPGCDYNGTTSVTVTDPNPAYSTAPTYQVVFWRPLPLPILFSVNIVNSQQVPADAAGQIRQAIIDAAAGLDGGPAAKIGSTILASRFVAPIAALGSWAQIRSIQVGSENQGDASVVGSIAGNTLTVTQVVSGTIVIGDTLSTGSASAASVGSGAVLPGTIINSQSTGSAGGTGTYLVSVGQTSPSQSMGAARPVNNSVSVNINQEPTVVAPNIVVAAT